MNFHPPGEGEDDLDDDINPVELPPEPPAKVAAEQSWADIPTCHEQGLGIDQYRFPRTVFLPGGVSDEQRAFYVELMRKVSQTAEFRDYVERSALAPTFLAGEDLVSYIEKDRQRVIPLFREAGWLRQ